MDYNLLEAAKEKLVHTTEFREVYDFFIEQFGEEPEFLEWGVPTRSKVVEMSLSQVVAQMLRKKIQVAALMMLRLPDYPFLFGGFQADKLHGNFIYFDRE